MVSEFGTQLGLDAQIINLSVHPTPSNPDACQNNAASMHLRISLTSNCPKNSTGQVGKCTGTKLPLTNI